MPNTDRLLLLEAAHEADRNLAEFFRIHRENHAKAETAIRTLAKRLRKLIKTLNAEPLLEEFLDANMVQRSTAGRDEPVAPDP